MGIGHPVKHEQPLRALIPSLSIHQFPTVPTGTPIYEVLSHLNTGILVGLILFRSCESSQNPCEFVYVIMVLCLENITLLQKPTSSVS